MITYRRATGEDLEGIEALLHSHGLPRPPADVSDFVVAIRDGTVVGCGGLEIYEAQALLRSMAVSTDLKGRGLGTELFKRLALLASQRKVRNLHLLTTTATDFFQKFGFRLAERREAPGNIASTEEFVSLCPGTAQYLVFSLSQPSPDLT